MGQRNIWPPADSGGKLVSVDDTTYNIVRKAANISTGISADEVWEVVRAAFEAESKARDKQARHARGDYGDEIREAKGLVTDLVLRTDGDAYAKLQQMHDHLDRMQSTGFVTGDPRVLLSMHDEFTEELGKTTEIAVKLQGILLEMKGD